jgi:stress-induced morphogen
MAAASMQAAQANRGDIRDIKAIQADVDKYKAAGMQAPLALQAEAYQAAQMQGAQLQGPKSWTDPGVAQQYMNPYQQAVIDQSKFEANRQAAQQRNQMRSQAVGSKAFGGTRAALQEAEANRNLGYTLEDIQNKGMQQAYQSGMGQFSAEQGLGLQAGQSNLQAALTMQQQNQAATNAQRQMYVQQALDAAKTSYGGELTAAQQNQIAQNAAAQFNSQSQNTAYNNYAAQQLAASQANQGMDWNTVNLNTQNQQAAALANAQFQQQAAQQNQAATNQQRSQYVNNALQAAMQAYGGQLTAEQQNQAAANAASQFNAQQNIQGQMANQQAGLQANQQNIGAYGQLGNMGQGLGALGTQVGNYNSNLANLWGQAGGVLQGLGQNYYNQKQTNAGAIWGGPTTLGGQGTGLLSGAGGTTGTRTGTSTTGSAFP